MLQVGHKIKSVSVVLMIFLKCNVASGFVTVEKVSRIWRQEPAISDYIVINKLVLSCK